MKFRLIPQPLLHCGREGERERRGIKVTQPLDIVPNAMTGDADTVRITYVAENTTGSSHTVGLRMLVDTAINANNNAIFRTTNDGIITYEREYLASAIPSTVDVLSNSSDTTHVGVVTLRGGDATPPDRLLLMRNPGTSGTAYDATISPTLALGDSVYVAYWLPITVAPGASRTVVSYYGRAAGGRGILTLPDAPKHTTSYYIQSASLAG